LLVACRRNELQNQWEEEGGFTSRLGCCCGGVTEREGWDESSCWLSEGPADISRWWLKKKELWEIDIIGVRARSHERGEWESKQSVGKTSVAASSTGHPWEFYSNTWEPACLGISATHVSHAVSPYTGIAPLHRVQRMLIHSLVSAVRWQHAPVAMSTIPRGYAK